MADGFLSTRKMLLIQLVSGGEESICNVGNGEEVQEESFER